MQPKAKPTRINLKVKSMPFCPPSVDEIISILKKNDFNPKSVPHVAISDLFYYLILFHNLKKITKWVGIPLIVIVLGIVLYIAYSTHTWHPIPALT